MSYGSMGFEKCIVPCIHHYIIIQTSFSALKNPLCFTYSTFLLFFEPLITTNHQFTIAIVLSFPKCCINGMVWYVAFLNGFIHLAIYILDSPMSCLALFFITEWYSIICIYTSCLSIYLLSTILVASSDYE